MEKEILKNGEGDRPHGKSLFSRVPSIKFNDSSKL